MAERRAKALEPLFPGTALLSQLAPAHLSLAAQLCGVAPPRIESALRYLLIGVEDARIPALLAASHPNFLFMAIDTDRDRLSGADRLLTELRLDNVRLDHIDLETADGHVLPGAPFDMVAVPALYARLDAVDRRRMSALLRRTLAPGGLVQIGYPAMPASGGLLAAQHLIRTAARGGDDWEDRLGPAMELVQRLAHARAPALAGNLWLGASLQAWRAGRADTVIETWLGRPWHALFHWDVARELADAKLTHAGSTFGTAAALPNTLADVTAGLRHAATGETLADYVCGTLLRSDLYIHGSRPTAPQGLRAEAEHAPLAQALPPKEALMRLARRLGSQQAAADLQPLLAALAAVPRPAEALVSLQPPGPKRLSAEHLVRLLLSTGVAQPIPPGDRRSAAVATVRANAAAAHAAVAEDAAGRGLLVSARTGALGTVDAIQHLTYLALATGSAPFVDATLPFVERRLYRLTAAIPDPDGLRARIATVLQNQLPVWRRLDMV